MEKKEANAQVPKPCSLCSASWDAQKWLQKDRRGLAVNAEEHFNSFLYSLVKENGHSQHPWVLSR